VLIKKSVKECINGNEIADQEASKLATIQSHSYRIKYYIQHTCADQNKQIHHVLIYNGKNIWKNKTKFNEKSEFKYGKT